VLPARLGLKRAPPSAASEAWFQFWMEMPARGRLWAPLPNPEPGAPQRQTKREDRLPPARASATIGCGVQVNAGHEESSCGQAGNSNPSQNREQTCINLQAITMPIMRGQGRAPIMAYYRTVRHYG
jgi:hypothetical protein